MEKQCVDGSRDSSFDPVLDIHTWSESSLDSCGTALASKEDEEN